jgi:hypothetical protein
LSDFNETGFFFDRYWKNTQMLNFMKIRPVGAELFHVVGQTDIDTTQLIVAVRSFAKAPKMALCEK